MTERWISSLAGGGLLAYGLYRRGTPGWASAVGGAALLFRGVSGHCSLYSALGVDTADHTETGANAGGLLASATRVRDAVTIDRPPEEIYGFWRDLSNLQIIIPHLHCVDEKMGGESHWIADVLGRKEVHWEAVITEDNPGQLIAWKTIEGSDFHHSGHVEFAPGPGGHGTEVRITMQYRPPLGIFGAAAAKLLNRSPQSELSEGLRRLKHMIEAGEIITAGGPAGEADEKIKQEAVAAKPRQKADQNVHEASEESFPASDPPSFTPGHT